MSFSSSSTSANDTSGIGSSSSGGASGFSSIGTKMSVIGAVGSMVGAYYGNKATSRALEFQKFTAETNARLAEKAAQSVLLQGQAEANRIQLKGAQVKGAQRASLAANGVDLGEGSAARVQANTEMITQMDVDTVQDNALRAAWGYRVQGGNYQSQAAFASASAPSMGGALSSSLLSGATQVASNWYKSKG